MSVKEIFILALWAASPLLSAQDITLAVSNQIDWEKPMLTIDIKAETEKPWTGPSTRYNIDEFISQKAPALMVESMADILLDSENTIASAILSDSSLYRNLIKLSAQVDKTISTAAQNRRSLTIRYEIPIFPHIGSIFVKRLSADLIEEDLRFKATANFTGILIYAGEELPLHGTNRNSLVSPSIFPRIYDEALNLLVDVRTVEPEYLRKWGTAGFSKDKNREYYGKRIGAFPLRTMAIAVFGKNETDLILNETATQRILSSAHNRELLSQGRLMIVYSDRN